MNLIMKDVYFDTNENKLGMLLHLGSEFLQKKLSNIDDNDDFMLDAILIMMKILNCSKVNILINKNISINDFERKKFIQLINKRSTGKPIQYIIGYCEFMSLDFIVDKNVLIPRPDTEILAESIIKYVTNLNKVNILEIGTGSGCLSISIGKHSANSTIIATDINKNILEIAKKNAILNNVKVKFIQSDLFENLDQNYYNTFDIIFSNPPYIPTEGIKELNRNVKSFEPLIALDGGVDGLDFYRKITNESVKYLKRNGMLFYEIGFDQKDAVRIIMKQNNFNNITCLKDLAGLDRVVYGKVGTN